MNKMQQQIIEWLADGETGLSSKTMAFVVGFDVVPKRACYPQDPAGLRRCMQLLTVAPAMRNHLSKLTSICPVWAEIIKNWAELEATYNQEITKARMPKTYSLLQKYAEQDKKRVVIGNGVSIRLS
ncbi:hypothetical protein QAA07_04560 [Glaesserella parasuis]|uniref:hypothetical protein n=1 Tax=Glaesserella parasuis TaxID=738 RepID=UPI0024368482|nr:hypothetical protein [Glaesserella parasuis]MDG6341471.1 hypothetical protein [Glaesserella parasuis]MDG6367528.1 hypothetical protein [Glaesserella parasuis]